MTNVTGGSKPCSFKKYLWLLRIAGKLIFVFSIHEPIMPDNPRLDGLFILANPQTL